MNENYRKSKQSSEHGNWVTTFLLFISFSCALSLHLSLLTTVGGLDVQQCRLLFGTVDTQLIIHGNINTARSRESEGARENFYVIAVSHRKGEDSIFSMLRCETHTGEARSSSETLTLTHIAHILPRSPQLLLRDLLQAHEHQHRKACQRANKRARARAL